MDTLQSNAALRKYLVLRYGRPVSRRVDVNEDVLGASTSNFTALNKLFLNNPLVVYWRFEVTYSFDSDSSHSALNFIINQPPQNGSCSISPQNGTTSTVFTIDCPNWFDEDQIGDYSLYGKAPIIVRYLDFSSMKSDFCRLHGGCDRSSNARF